MPIHLAVRLNGHTTRVPLAEFYQSRVQAPVAAPYGLEFSPIRLALKYARKTERLQELFACIDPRLPSFVEHFSRSQVTFASPDAYKDIVSRARFKRDPGDTESYETVAHYSPGGGAVIRTGTIEQMIASYTHEMAHAVDDSTGTYMERTATMAETLPLLTQLQLGYLVKYDRGPWLNAQRILERLHENPIFRRMSFAGKWNYLSSFNHPDELSERIRTA